MVTETSNTPESPESTKVHDTCITVLLPSHNGARYLANAVDSVLNQTYENLRLIIIDDASTDDTASIAQRYCDQDDRVELLCLSTQHGLANALNVALAQRVRTAWFAIQNDDDWWHPDKLQRQWDFAQAHPEISVLGTAAHLMGPDGQVTEFLPVPESSLSIRLAECASDCMFTPSVILKTNAVKQAGGFGSGWNYSEDYLLWSKLLRFTELGNLSEPLFHYRWHGGNMSVTQGNRQVMDSIRITRQYVNDWFGLGVYRDHVLFWYPPQYQRQYRAYKRTHLNRVVECIRLMSQLLRVFSERVELSCDERRFAAERQLMWLDHALYGLSLKQRWWVYARVIPAVPLAFWLRQAKRLLQLNLGMFARPA